MTSIKRLKSVWQFMIAIVIAMLIFQRGAIADGCFTVLTDPTARTFDDFKDLAALQPLAPTMAPGVKRFLPFGGGVGDVMNIDFYYIKFAPAPGKSLQQVFKDLRLHFGQFARGKTGDFDFGPYSSIRPWEPGTDPNLKRNETLWKSDNPMGALMSFDLDTLWPSTFIGGATALVKSQDGDLQVTCATPTDFVFSTVDTVRGGPHPVAGNRGFGLKDNGDGTWMFYSKAADRESDLTLNGAAHILHWVRLSGSIFCLGHKFWMGFFPAMSEYLGAKGMPTKEFFSTNHGPTAWPFKPGPQTPAISCS
jgi:hypothetical protein